MQLRFKFEFVKRYDSCMSFDAVNLIAKTRQNVSIRVWSNESSKFPAHNNSTSTHNALKLFPTANFQRKTFLPFSELNSSPNPQVSSSQLN